MVLHEELTLVGCELEEMSSHQLSQIPESLFYQFLKCGLNDGYAADC